MCKIGLTKFFGVKMLYDYGVSGGGGVSQPMSTAVHMESNKLCRSNCILFNLRVGGVKML